MKKVFFIDIDGTILDSFREVTVFNINALYTARANGHKVFINTGRGKACIPSTIFSLPLDGIVSGCGCTITINGKDVYSDCPPIETMVEYVEQIFNKGQRCFLEGENHLFRVNCEPVNELEDKQLAKYCKAARLNYNIWHPLSCAKELLNFPEARIPKLNLVGDFSPEEIKHYDRHFDGVVDDCKCEMFSKNNSKATGLKYVMENYFPGYSSVAIGDSENDREMLKTADISVAMGNAADSIKNMCTFTTDTCDADGVGKAVIKLIEERNLI